MPRPLALLALFFALVLSACSTSVGKREPDAPVYNWPYPNKSAGSQPEEEGGAPRTSGLGSESSEAPNVIASLPSQPLPDFPRSADQVSGSAVASLIRQAQAARAARQPEQAQAKLERALKIEPRNYFAWSALAATYLDQKNYEQAISVAGKSNSLARGNIYVELDNYRVIQEARQALGESDAAFQAKARADEIQQRLQAADPAHYSP